jgi:hypothetical protein
MGRFSRTLDYKLSSMEKGRRSPAENSERIFRERMSGIDKPTEAEINDAIGRNLKRGWIIGSQGEYLIVNSFTGLGSCLIDPKHWPDLKLVIDAMMIPARENGGTKTSD